MHYFGRVQPVNFWDAAVLSEAPAHLARIRADGYNAVVIVVPWRGFQRTLTPSTFDTQNIARLRRLLAMVQASGLKYVLRVSYPWNNDPDSEGDYDERILALFSMREVRQAWLAYLREIRRIAEAHDAFQFAFFSWEDMPSIRELMIHRYPLERMQLAGPLGYRRYLASRFTLAEVSRRFGQPLASFDEVTIPQPDSEAYRTYHEFVDHSLANLLADARAAWPRITMQLRVDFDPVLQDGATVWFEHDMRLEDRNPRVTYFFPFMYADSQGKDLAAREVLANLERMLQRVTDGGRNPRHYLDQFVFHDESPQFRNWSRVRESEMGEYLLGAAQLLRRLSQGFAFWNYFDYRVNHFYNPSFIRGLHGWKVQGGVSLGPGDEARYVTLAPGASFTQYMMPDMVGYSARLYETMQFAAAVRCEGAGRLRLLANGETDFDIGIAAGQREIEQSFPPDRHRGGHVHVTIENAGAAPLEISDLQLWGFVYRSRIYDEHGNPGRYHAVAHAMIRA